jgi:hypothetical protein
MLFGKFLLVLDITLHLVWLSYYLYLLSTGTTNTLPYLSSHFSFTVHTIATLRLINIIESNGNRRSGSPMFFWNVATFIFATVYDALNLVYVCRFVPQNMGDIWGWELGLGIAFVTLSCLILCWYIVWALNPPPPLSNRYRRQNLNE